MLSLYAFASLASTAYAAIGPVGDLEIASTTVSPDGFERAAIIAGGSTPGALISGNKGDTFQITVVNSLDDDSMRQTTSIHWHGVLQTNGSNWADGGAFVNQCPIAKGNSFTYEFTEPDQAGTYWYHSHLSTQYCDGLRGPLVIYDPDDPYLDQYDVDDESTVITLSDWYHDLAETITLGTSDTTLINGLGRYGGDGGTSSNLTVISVEQGKTYRFRFVNIACDPAFTVSIDNHTSLTIIEADGVNTEKVTVDSFTIYAGQRYSVIFTADQDVGNYWLRADPNAAAATGFSGGINSAIIRYVGADEEEPTTEQDDLTNALVETDLIPLEDPAAPGNATQGDADVVINLAMAFTGSFTINGEQYTSPSVPVLLQILSGAESAQSLLPSGSVYTIDAGDIVEISMPALAAGGPHPFHLHGHTFSVVRAAGSDTYNYDNPPRRDVVSTGTTGDNVTIRFTADNSGPWFLHCHIDWHLELGLAVVLAEAADSWNGTITPPDAWDQLCPIYDALDDSDL